MAGIAACLLIIFSRPPTEGLMMELDTNNDGQVDTIYSDVDNFEKGAPRRAKRRACHAHHVALAIASSSSA